MKRLAPFLLLVDLALFLSGSAALLILLTGGGELHLGRFTVGAWRARNALTVTVVLAGVRFLPPWRTPFLLVPRLDAEGPSRLAARAARVLHAWLAALTPSTTVRVLALILVASFGMKAANAAYYYGFFSGDDVEIHQMTFSALLGRDLGVWSLRSPFYPMVFIYPAQWLLKSLGFGDPLYLILAGRMVVALFSCVLLWLVYRVAAAHLGGLAVGLLAALLLATSRLHIRFGSSELPGPLASVFLVLAFWLLLSRPRSAPLAALAGAAVGMAAALRFSEAVFAVPLAVHLVAERRIRDLLLALAAAAAAAACILGPGDFLYWGRPFLSLRNIVDFTLVRKASSRGFEPAYFYLTQAPVWSNVFTLGFFVVALARRGRRAALWLVLPILALSLLPHKEERYLVPATPFLALGAAQGLWALLERVRGPGRERAALLLVFALSGALAFELEGARFRRSESGVDVARHLARQPGLRHVAIEQAWRAGSNLYLVGAHVEDIDPGRLGERSYLGAVLRPDGLQYVALREDSIRKQRLEALLASAGFEPVPFEGRRARERYVLFGRNAPP